MVYRGAGFGVGFGAGLGTLSDAAGVFDGFGETMVEGDGSGAAGCDAINRVAVGAGVGNVVALCGVAEGAAVAPGTESVRGLS